MPRGHVRVARKRVKPIRYGHNRGNNIHFRGGVPIPVTTPACIIFPYDKENKKFITSDYSSAQTKERASAEEIERFLNEVNEPLSAWSEQYGLVYEGKGIYFCLFITFLILLPIFICYVCWLSSKQSEAKKALTEVKQKIRTIIQERGSYFAEKGLEWKIPIQFPHWLELWTGEDGKPGAGDIEMAAYQQSGYPQLSQQGNSVAPVQDGNQQQFMYNANMYGQEENGEEEELS